MKFTSLKCLVLTAAAAGALQAGAAQAAMKTEWIDYKQGATPLSGYLVYDDAVPGRRIPKSQNGALYFPWLTANDEETGAPITIAPGGTVAGLFAREDVNRGVWKAPAGLETILAGTDGVVASGRMTDPRHGTLNPLGVNVLRDFPGIGTVVFGARTLVAANPAFQQYRYVPVRRTALFLEQSHRRRVPVIRPCHPARLQVLTHRLDRPQELALLHRERANREIDRGALGE